MKPSLPPSFVRHVAPQLLQDLKASELFDQFLLPDIEDGKVFPSLRIDRIDFFYSGGRLFSFSSKGFETHVKFAAVFKGIKNYVLESKLSTVTPISSFADPESYTRIKENCANYSGIEAKGVSNICRGFGAYIADPSVRVIPLDVEIGFSGASQRTLDDVPEMGKGPRWDRIDLLLYDTVDRTLRFAEAKHSSNPELWGNSKKSPKVAEQLLGYTNRIRSQGSQIIAAYGEYVKNLNSLFGTNLLAPTGFCDPGSVFLLVFGFDRVQRGPFLQRLLSQQDLSGYYYYSCGDTKRTNPLNIWNEVRPIP